MHRIRSEEAVGRVLLAIIGLMVLLAFEVAAATISLSGIVEGAQMVLAPSATATNLTIAATPSLGTPPVKLTLERSGVVFVNVTATPPYSVIFSNLIAGKYFLSA